MNNITPPLCTLCTLMPRIIPLFTLTLVERTWYEESTPGNIVGPFLLNFATPIFNYNFNVHFVYEHEKKDLVIVIEGGPKLQPQTTT